MVPLGRPARPPSPMTEPLPDRIEELIRAMDPDESVRAGIRLHLLRQRGVRAGQVKLAGGAIVAEGETE
jgi:hypothetical protein